MPVVSTATATPKNHPINPRTPPTIPQFANLILDGEKRDGKGSIMDKVSVASEARRVMSRAAATNQYLDATGAIIAHYEYDAFGNVVNYTEAATDQASSFRHRFSTKQQDDESGFLYYGFRCYVQLTESWPSRDPIEESGGLNLFGFLADYHAAIDFFTIGIVKFKEGYGL